MKHEQGKKLIQEFFKLICTEFNKNNKKKIAMARHFFIQQNFNPTRIVCQETSIL